MARIAAVLACVLCAFSTASAEIAPTEALQQVFAKANDILTDPGSAARPLDRLLAVRRLVNDAFDFKGAAELASGDHWRARSEAEQEEFTWLFSDLLERSFISSLAAKANLDGGTRIRYLDETTDGETAIVQTAMARRNGGELMLGYRLVERAGGWKIRDVAIDGVSLMANYRAQLDRVLGNASFPELLTQMRAKVGVVDEDARPAATMAVVDLAPPAAEFRVATFEPVVTVPVTPDPPTDVAAEAPASPATVEPPRARATKAYWLRMMVAGTTERIGPFQDAEEAVLKLLDLQTKGHDPYLIAEPR
jgi:phospholipid transport system substrate-binding protein